MRNEKIDSKRKSKKYRLEVINLDPIELKRSRLPDNKITSIWASFTSISNKHYEAVHVYEHPHGPYILLSGLDKDRQDFSHVEKIIAKETKGIPENSVSDRGNDICDIIRLNKKPTQARVADFVVNYFKHFKDVRIPVAYFRDISKTDYKNSRLPLDKIRGNPFL